jgi:ribokinase
VVGNAVWDETLHLAELPAPGASIHVSRGTEGPGGKGLNQAVVLARAGVATTLVSVVGRDAAGERLTAAASQEGLVARLMRRDDLRSDWSVVLVTGHGENAVLTTSDCATSLHPEEGVAALADARPDDLCLLQGNLADVTTEAVIAAARARGLSIALNPSPAQPAFRGLLASVDILFLNRDEARAFAGTEDPAAVRSLGARQTVVTRGADGALLITPEAAEAVTAVSARCIDPTGAGDAFLGAALAHARPRGWQIDRRALEAGAAAAAIAVGGEGAFASLPDREALAAIIARR